MKALIVKTFSILSAVFFLTVSTDSHALRCISFTGKNVNLGKVASPRVGLLQRAEEYAKKRQTNEPLFRIQIAKKFYRGITKLLLLRNVKPISIDEEGNPVITVGRISIESSRHVYDLVIQLKSLLGQSLITDVDIVNANNKLKLDRAKVAEMNAKIDVLNSELATLKVELQSVQVSEGSQNLMLNNSDRARREATISERAAAVKSKEEEVGALTVQRDTLAENAATGKEELARRMSLRKELVGGLRERVATYDALPAKIKALTTRMKVRSKRILVLKEVQSLTAQNIFLPEYRDGNAIWVEARYDKDMATKEVERLNRQIKGRVLKKQVKELYNRQAEILVDLKVAIDYFLDAKEHSPETFGPPKEKLLALMVGAVSKIENAPGYAAIKDYERKIFFEEFNETFGTGGFKPREVLVNRLVEEAGAIRSNLLEAGGAVPNSIAKRVRATVTGIILASTSLGAGAMNIPDGAGSVVSGVISSGTAVIETQVSRGLFKMDGLLGFKRAIRAYADTPDAEKSTWISALAEENGIDPTTTAGADILRAIITESAIIDKSEAEAIAIEAERQADRAAAIEEIMGESN